MSKFVKHAFRTKYESYAEDWFAANSELDALAQARKRWPEATSFKATPPPFEGMAWKVEATIPAEGQRTIFAWADEDPFARLQKKFPDEDLSSAELMKTEDLKGVVLDLIHEAYTFFGWENAGFSEKEKETISKAKAEHETYEVTTSASGNSFEVISDKYKFYYCVDCS